MVPTTLNWSVRKRVLGKHPSQFDPLEKMPSKKKLIFPFAGGLTTKKRSSGVLEASPEFGSPKARDELPLPSPSAEYPHSEVSPQFLSLQAPTDDCALWPLSAAWYPPRSRPSLPLHTPVPHIPCAVCAGQKLLPFVALLSPQNGKALEGTRTLNPSEASLCAQLPAARHHLILTVALWPGTHARPHVRCAGSWSEAIRFGVWFRFWWVPLVLGGLCEGGACSAVVLGKGGGEGSVVAADAVRLECSDAGVRSRPVCSRAMRGELRFDEVWRSSRRGGLLQVWKHWPEGWGTDTHALSFQAFYLLLLI